MRTTLWSSLLLATFGLAGCPPATLPPAPEPPPAPAAEDSETLRLTDVEEDARIRIVSVESPQDDSLAIGATCTVIELSRMSADDSWEGAVNCGGDDVDVLGYEELVFTLVK